MNPRLLAVHLSKLANMETFRIQVSIGLELSPMSWKVSKISLNFILALMLCRPRKILYIGVSVSKHGKEFTVADFEARPYIDTNIKIASSPSYTLSCSSVPSKEIIQTVGLNHIKNLFQSSVTYFQEPEYSIESWPA